ncbi:MAG TPA: succinylglutamate desuccinylase/aspartoacylase family protein, partial [Sumerlaeia bacterium]|nr:succinylglutamate desuccinylase/aspartoacylase family protein [Sumerlaeia bacterium]
EVFKRIKRRLLCGAVYAFPLMNPIGFETTSRSITMSREDLNRSFPGNPTGSLGERIADRIFATIMETAPSLVLDLHNDWIRSIPYVLIDRDPGSSHRDAYEKTKELGRRAGFCTIVDADMIGSALSYNLLLNDVPALTLEVGEPYVINETNVEYGLLAVWNVLAHLGMAEAPKDSWGDAAPLGHDSAGLLRYTDKPYSSKSGIVRFLAKPGDQIKAGQAFAKIVNAFGKHQETMAATNDAIVLGHSDSSVVFPGMPVMAFGIA